VIALPGPVLEDIREHGRLSYPEECCGGLLGALREGVARVVRAERMENVSRQRRERRFEIEPRDYLRLEKAAVEAGLTVLGFYHSHPNHRAAPSAYDREQALPFLHYVIVAVEGGRPGEATSWILSEDRGVFEPEELLLEAPGSV
jgi:proteasome lid subunit RPN8/RPN11